MKLKTFLLHVENADQIKMLSDEEAGILFKSLYDYVLNGKELITKNRVLLMSFLVIKSQIDRGFEKYETTCQKRKEAINKRWEKYKSIQENTNEYKSIQMNTNVCNSNPNPNPNSNPNPKEENKKENTLTSIKEKSTATDVATLLQKRKDKFYDSLVPFVELYGKSLIRNFFDYWTEPNKSQTKMRYELERTWDVKRRLRTWASRDKNYNQRNYESIRKEQSQTRATEAATLIARLAAEDDARKVR